jgi:hypothetical protein
MLSRIIIDKRHKGGVKKLDIPGHKDRVDAQMTTDNRAAQIWNQLAICCCTSPDINTQQSTSTFSLNHSISHRVGAACCHNM